MKLIPIHTCDILRNSPYLHDTQGRLDLLGQIILTGYNIPVPMKTRTPAELDTTIYPFTTMIRQYSRCNTALTLDLLANIGLSGKQQLKEANKLLLKFQIQLEEVDK